MTSLSTPEDVEQAVEQLQRLYRAVADLRASIAPLNPQKFALLAEGPLDQIRELLAELDAHAATESGGAGRTLWLHVEGQGIRWPDAPSSVLASLLDILRKGVQAVAEFTARGMLSTRPTAELKRACDLRMVALAPGSLRVAVRAPENVELADVAGRALDTYLDVAAWAGSGESDEHLERMLPDATARRLALAELGRLVPRQRGDIERIELSGTALGKRSPIVLARETRQRIGGAMSRLVHEQTFTVVGTLREIDLDKRTFILRNSEELSETPCDFPEELLETAKEALDKRVEVTGTKRAHEVRRAAPRLFVTTLEILDEEPPLG